MPLVLPDEEAVATVQLWSRLREDVVTDMTRVRNRLHALLLLCDPTYTAHIPDVTTRTGVRACQAYTAPGQGALARQREQAVRQVAAHLALLADQEQQLHRQLESAVAQRFAPLEPIPGLGPLTAAALVAELGQASANHNSPPWRVLHRWKPPVPAECATGSTVRAIAA